MSNAVKEASGMGYELFIVRSLKIFLASLPAAPFCFQIRPALALLRVKTSTSPSPLPSPEVERESEDEDELSIFLGFIHSFGSLHWLRIQIFATSVLLLRSSSR
jgi:hypothetical protein